MPGHEISNLPKTNMNVYGRKSCEVCKKKKVRRKSSFWCKTCQVALCKNPCFDMFHAVKSSMIFPTKDY